MCVMSWMTEKNIWTLIWSFRRSHSKKKKKKSDFNRISDHIWMFTNIRFMFFFFQNGFESDPIFSACLNKALKSHCDETRAADNDSHADSWKEGLLYRATADWQIYLLINLFICFRVHRREAMEVCQMEWELHSSIWKSEWRIGPYP